jgi:ParB-like chromosome segregation protein Spo0J
MNVTDYPDLPEYLKVENRPTTTTAAADVSAEKPVQPSKWRDQIKVHPAADLFPIMSDAELDALAADIKKNGVTQPVVFWGKPGLLIDGRNRIEAYVRAGIDGQIQHFHVDESVDPYTYVISANIHRRHLTSEQKRELIAKLLKANPAKSDRQVAETIKASPTTVGTVRKKLEAAGDVSKLDTRKDTMGRKQPAKKAKPKTAAAEEARDRAEVCRLFAAAEAAAAELEAYPKVSVEVLNKAWNVIVAAEKHYSALYGDAEPSVKEAHEAWLAAEGAA